MTAETLAAILHRSPVILLDFDGPVCSVFAGHPAAQIADDLRALAYDQLGLLPAGAASIAYANKPGKADALTAAGADAVIDNISELTGAIRASWPATG